MTAVEDRLADIEVRLLSPMVTYKENATEDAPALVAALWAVLAVCNEIEPNTFGDSLIEADDIRRAIANVLDVTP